MMYILVVFTVGVGGVTKGNIPTVFFTKSAGREVSPNTQKSLGCSVRGAWTSRAFLPLDSREPAVSFEFHRVLLKDWKQHRLQSPLAVSEAGVRSANLHFQQLPRWCRLSGGPH